MDERAGGGTEVLTARARLALLSGAVARWASRAARRGAGANISGAVAQAIDPGLLQRLTTGRATSVVSATNGKTTTTRMLAAALAAQGRVLSNVDGSNLQRGVLAAMMTDPRRTTRQIALEVDELALPEIARMTSPDLFVLGNLSRDQLDRMTECRVIVRKWTAMLSERAAEAARQGRTVTVIANCDDALVAGAVVGTGLPLGLAPVWVAVGQRWTLDAASCPLCSTPWVIDVQHYECRSCGFARPTPTWELRGAQLQGPGELSLPLDLALPGRSNRANAVLAVAAAQHWGIGAQDAVRAISKLTEVSGRYALVDVHGGPTRLLLAKNPASWLEMIAQHADEGSGRPLVLALNARTADGKDTSWIWDVPFELLGSVPVVISGERRADLAVRLRYAEIDHLVVVDPLEAVRAARGMGCAKDTSNEPITVDLLATYTAFSDVRRALQMPA